jgi:drug/metabolite transporter (DMT)-like permease
MNEEKKGLIELVTAAFFFSLFGVFTRLIANNLGVFYQLFLRAVIMAGLFYVIARFSNNLKKIQKKDWGLLIFRGLLVVVDFSCFYFAVTNLSLSLTLFLFYASNVLTAFLFGYLFLQEKMTPIKYVSLIFALAGLFVMFKDSFGGIKLLPALATQLSGLCFGLTTTTSKKLTGKYSPVQVNLIGYVTTFLLVIPLLLFSKEKINLNLSPLIWMELFGFAVVGVGAFLLTLEGFKHVEAQKGSIVMLAELIFVTLIGLIWYSEIPTPNTILGGLFIMTALIIPNLKFRKGTIL